MMNKLLLGTAASALFLSTAFAQAPSSPPAGSPATTPPAVTSTPPAAPAPSSTTMAPAASPAQQVVTAQTPDQFLASKFNGTDVIGADDKKVGDVSDILFDKDGKVLAYVVGVGGFLGIGSKNIALSPSAFQLVKGTNNESDKLKISMSQEQLKDMASFEAYQPPRATTTGAGPGAGGMGTRPTGGTTR
jgi:sporulation protein YlmC with PRC-barrel domain